MIIRTLKELDWIDRNKVFVEPVDGTMRVSSHEIMLNRSGYVLESEEKGRSGRCIDCDWRTTIVHRHYRKGDDVEDVTFRDGCQCTDYSYNQNPVLFFGSKEAAQKHGY